MIYDQEKVAEKEEKYSEIDDTLGELTKENENLINKQMYYEDLLEAKEQDIRQRKTDLSNANKKIQELNRLIEDMKGNRKSTGSLNGKNDMTSSFRSERKQR